MQREDALLALFTSLGPPTATGALSGVAVSRDGSLYICRDGNGRPAFLLPCNVPLPPVRLENLEVRHRVRCSVTASDRVIPIESATLICCLSSDADLQHYFIETLGAVLRSHASNGDVAQLAKMVEGLSELFQAITSEPASTAQGLWAELALISRAANPTILVDAWHAEADDLFDFSLGTERIEVKSSVDKTRCHHFRLEQVEEIPCVKVLIASVLVDRAARGSSLGDLWDRCRDSVAGNPALQVKVDAICFRALGKHWRRWRDLSYDYHRAVSSMLFFDASVLPKPLTPVPPGVSDLRFIADLSVATPIESSWLIRAGPLARTIASADAISATS